MTLGVIPLSTVPASAVIHLAINILSQHSSPPNLHEAAADCLINLLTRLEREEVMTDQGLHQGCKKFFIRSEHKISY